MRNKAIYENIRASPAHIYRQVIWLLNVISAAHPFISSSPEDISLRHLGLIPFLWQSRIAVINTLVWSTPSYLFMKLNVDSSSLGNLGYSGDRSIIRDHNGQIKRAFSSFYGFYTNMESEAMALLEGLQLCTAMGFPKMVVNMDSEQLLNLVRQTSPTPWRIDGIIRWVQHEMTKTEFILEHCYKEINSAADAWQKRWLLL